MHLSESKKLEQARDAFITQWGTLGSAWGINRTMAQVHALLLANPSALNTDQVMESLQISRGNAHSNLKELVSWGLVRNVLLKGERKEYFEAEKDVWKIFCAIVRERKRREISPALLILESCHQQTKSLKSKEAQAFHNQMKELTHFVKLADNLMTKVARSEESKAISLARKFIN